MILGPAEVPSLMAPAFKRLIAVAASFIPPDALTCGTICFISSTSETVAPPVPNPVEVLTNETPVAAAN